MSNEPYNRQPLSRFERWFLSPVIFLMRAVVVAVSLVIWAAVIPLWLYLILRSIAVLSFANVLNIWRGAGSMSTARLERDVAFWPRGCIAILRMLLGDYTPPDARPRHSLEALQETLLCILFYTAMILTTQLARDYGGLLVKARHAVLPQLQAASAALLHVVQTHTASLF